MTLEDLGWSEPFEIAFENLKQEHPHLASAEAARVVSAQREHYRLMTPLGAFDAQLSGKLRHEALKGELPVAGDWVAAQLRHEKGSATIAACLPRKTSLVRKRVAVSGTPQVLCANLDCVLLVTSLNHDFNPRRIERTLAMIWESGAQPIVILSKADLCGDVEAHVHEVEAVAIGVPVHALSTQTGEGLDALDRYLRPGHTLALIGSSGVGKSTLVNHLLGEQRIETSAVSAMDDKGRHTTTSRELFVLGSGALLIDTPGMREIGLWDASSGLDAAFGDVEALATRCRFGDCKHASEPGCAIHEAIARGALEGSRFANYQKLQRELAHEARRQDPLAMAAYRRDTRVLSKLIRSKTKRSLKT